MRVLILSSNNGGGHNAAAQALREMFEAHGDSCQLADCLSFISSDVSRAVATSHNFMYRHAPKLFAHGYRHTQRHPETFCERHNGRRVLNLGRRNLGRALQAGGYDAAVCTHVFAALMLTDARRKYGLSLKTGVVETDYTCTPGAHASDLDWHFIPDASLRAELEALGVRGEKIVATGIPVRDAFYAPKDRRSARAALAIPPDSRVLLMMGGSMGAGPVPALTAALSDCLDEGELACVVCGTNRALEKLLAERHGRDPRFRILGYTDEIPRLMDAADLLMTKPGGISVTEAAVKRLPMVLVDSVAGCEACNLRFFLQNGGAVTADTPEALARAAAALLRDAPKRLQMSRALTPIATANNRTLIRNKLTTANN